MIVLTAEGTRHERQGHHHSRRNRTGWAYNQAVLAGEWLIARADSSRSSHRRDVGNGDVAAETHQVLKNLCAVLKELAPPLPKWCAPRCSGRPWRFPNRQWHLCRGVWRGHPARACVQVAALPREHGWKSTASPGSAAEPDPRGHRLELASVVYASGETHHR